MRKLIPVIFLLCSTQASAITTVLYSELPLEVRDCFQSNTCFNSVPQSSNALSTDLETVGAAAFYYYDVSDTVMPEKVLMRYELQAPPGTVGGIVWLTGNRFYDVVNSDTHDFALHPAPVASGTYPGNSLILRLNDADLLDGSAFKTIMYLGYPDPLEISGDLYTSAFPCIDPPCRTEDYFNLLHMTYDANGAFSFNANDTRSLLYQHRELYEYAWLGQSDHIHDTSLYIQAVPLPASAWLLLSGLAGGICLARRRT